MVEIYRVRGIGTQGRQDANQWVKTYTVSYGMNGVDFTQYKENRRVKVTDDQFFLLYIGFKGMRESNSDSKPLSNTRDDILLEILSVNK